MMIRAIGIALVGALVAACSGAPADGASGSENVATTAGPLARAFADQAATRHVPRDLMIAIARVEDGLDMPAVRDVDPDNEVPAAGPFMLRHGKLDTLGRAAALTGRTELELRRDTDLALEAGARVLAEVGAAAGARENDLASWSGAVAEMSGYVDEHHRKDYVRRVFALLARGGTFEGRDGEKITLPAHDEIPPTLTLDTDPGLHTQAVAEFPGAEWIPTSCVNKCNDNRFGEQVHQVVIHDTEGGWDASVATLQNDAGKSVHYIIGTDGKIAQFIPESYTGWHAGNAYYNHRTVGIEHVGYRNKPFTEAQYAASAKLVTHLHDKYKFALDRSHVIGHDQIPWFGGSNPTAAPCGGSPKDCEANSNYGGAAHHTDPGIWEWATYMPRIGGSAKCNDVTSLLNCSYDHTHAFRCTGGQVEVKTCSGANKCTVQANGVDDVCDESTTTPQSGGDTGSDLTPPTAAGEPDTSDGPPRSGSSDGDFMPPAEDSGGCSVGGPSPRASSTWMFGVVLGLAAVAARRRRRSH